MSLSPVLYRVRTAAEVGRLAVDKVWEQSGVSPLPAGATHMFPLERGDARTFIAVSGKDVQAFRFRSGAPWFEPVYSHIKLDAPCDIIEPFTLGNVAHLLGYEAEVGQFTFIPLDDELTARPAYQYSRGREPGLTTGFTVTKPLVIGDGLYYLCYGFDTGTVNTYSLSVTADSSARVAPLRSAPVWLHQWARRWTRFAWFELGGSNFFLKTNVGRLNVNIDRARDNAADGTLEVGTHLDLTRALDLDICRAFYLDGAHPYFLTYEAAGGATTFNRIYGDCTGWDTEASADSVAGATQIVPLRHGRECFVLFC